MLSRLKKYHNQFNSIDALKCLAVFSMFIDHLGIYLLNDDANWRIAGRLAAPLFFFLAGFNTSSQKKLRLTPWQAWFKNPLNLITFGIILTLSYYLVFQDYYLNILINIFLIKQLLLRYKPKKKANTELILLGLALALLNVFVRDYIEYGLLGLIYALGGQLIFEKRKYPAYLIFVIAICAQFSNYWYNSDFNHDLIIATSLVVFFVLSTFQFQIIQVPRRLKILLIFCSRYTFELYFSQLFLLQIYALIFLPGKFQ